jgi:hypothetical protein
MMVITPDAPRKFEPIKWVKAFAWAEITIKDDDGRIRIVRRYRMAQK